MWHDLVQVLAKSSLAPLVESLAGGARRNWLHGARGTGKSLAVATLIAQSGVRFILTPSQERAETLYADLNALAESEQAPVISLCPSLESLLYEETSPDYQLIRDRLSVLSRLASGENMVVIATPDALLHRTLPPEIMRDSCRTISTGDEVQPAELAAWLAENGYSREGMVEQPGQFSLRGGVLDIFPSTENDPVRLEYFGDEIDSLRVFNPDTQRSRSSLPAVRIFPAREILLSPGRVEIALPLIKEALKARLEEVSHKPIRLPGEDGETEELLSPAERLSAKIEHEMALMEQGAYFNGVEYYLPYLYPEGATLLDYLPEEMTVVLDDPEHIAHSFHRFQAGLAQIEQSRLNRGALLPTPHPLYLPLNDGLHALSRRQEVAVSLLPPGIDASFTDPVLKIDLEEEVEREIPAAPSCARDLLDGVCIDLECRAPVNYILVQGQLEADLNLWKRESYMMIAATHQEHRLVELVGGYGIAVSSSLSPGSMLVKRAALTEGVILPTAKIVLLTDSELLGWQKQRRVVRHRQAQGHALASVNQLQPGDFVVHINHGIGQYTGLVRRDVQGGEREFLRIDYAGSDKLFVPVDQLDRVQKYISLDDGPPEVHRLGGAEWERIKRKTKKSTEELANQLLRLQAIRSREQGLAFSPDSPWQLEMEEGFPWRETPDQMQAIIDVKVDMEQPHPMDRLICGDVGYGKTEVALRAAFKAVMDGKQVAVLAPTTVLAAQHYRSFRERMAAFPVRVELLSRAVQKRDQTRIVADITGGAVDIVIGTHRILSQDMKFKDLGLMIVDEEQRFGVKQKERLKQFRQNVDIITMSATPIPRTLHMALSGLREMSIINTPPEGRMPVRTLAMEADDDVLREAILRELDRDGQIFVLHNRISSIYHVAERIRQIVPQARVEVAHGQMQEGELDNVMVDFNDRRFDVLVCTAIIENGVDFPNANTIIVDQAEMFGLAQLYQLRGRVGRSDRQAYAYLTWKPRKKLTEVAKERIAAMKEFSNLGSGYKVALRDLEIRGAGNLLGSEQSGVLAAVGYDLYCQMLDEAVRIVKGEVLPPEREVQIDIPLNALLPNDYIPELNQRIDLYRRLAAVRDWKFAEDLRAEMEDRFGKPVPEQVDNLFRMLKVKLQCYAAGIQHIGSERGAVVIKLAPDSALSPQAVKRLQLDAPKWRERGMPAPNFATERVTIVTVGYEQSSILSILEEVADRLRVIEQEVSRAPRAAQQTTPNRRDSAYRPYGR